MNNKHCSCFCRTQPNNKFGTVNHFCNLHRKTNNLIIRSLRKLIKDDYYLLEKEVNERSVTHKLAEHLQLLSPEWNIDCEYNKNLNNQKTLDFTRIVKGVLDKINSHTKERRRNSETQELSRELKNFQKKSLHDESGQLSFLKFKSKNFESKSYIKKVFPDIIAHLRGTRNNKIVIEAKLTKNTDQKARQFDLVKLALFTEANGQYCYDAGYFLELPNKINNRFEVCIQPFNDPLIQHINHSVFTVLIKNS